MSWTYEKNGRRIVEETLDGEATYSAYDAMHDGHWHENMDIGISTREAARYWVDTGEMVLPQ